MSGTQLHRCRFFDWTPSPVACVAIAKDSSYLIVAREGGTIELWDTYYWYCKKSIFTQIRHPSCINVEFENRVFIGGMEGYIYEIGGSFSVKNQWSTHGGLVVGMRKFQDKLYIACEDGSIRVFRMEADSMTLLDEVKHFENPIVSLSVDESNGLLACGDAMGLIHLISTDSDRIIHRMDLPSGKSGKAVVWSLEFASAGATLVSGDSNGTMTFWDTETGTMFQSFRTHESDILSLVVNKEGSEIFAGGVDSKISQFKMNVAGAGVILQTAVDAGEWAHVADKRVHEGTINSVSISDKYLVSGSNDCRVAVYRREDIQRRVMMLNPFIIHHGSYFSSVDKAKGLLLLSLKPESKLELYALGSHSAECRKLFSLKTSQKEQVTCCSMNDRSDILCYSTPSRVIYHRLDFEGASFDVKSKEKLPLGLSASCMQFLNDYLLLLGTIDSRVVIYDFESGRTHIVQEKDGSDDAVSIINARLDSDENGESILTSAFSRDGDIVIVNATLSDEFALNIVSRYVVPHLFSPFACFVLDKSSPLLYIATVTNHLFVFNFEEDALVFIEAEEPENEKEHGTTSTVGKRELLSRKYGIFHSILTLDVGGTRPALLVAAQNSFGVFDVDLKQAACRLRTRYHRYPNLLYINEANDNSLLVLERPWDMIKKSLPEPFSRKKYEKLSFKK